MATGTESAPLSPSSGGSDLEEGELVAGNDGSAGPDLEEGEFVAGPDDGIRHVGDGLPESKRCRLEFEGVVVDGGASLPSPTPSCDRDSDGTITDVDVDADAGAASLAQDPPFPGPVCRMEFTGQKAVSGAHMMSAHGPHGCLQGNEERPAVGGGSDVTGTRPDSVGGRSVSSESEGVVDPTATVVSEPVLDPMPLAFASSSCSSAEPNPPDDDSMDIDVEPPRNHTNKIVVRPPCSPQFLQGHRPAAPRVLVAQDRPAVTQGHQLAEDATRQFVLRQAAAAQAVAHHVQRTSLPRAGGHMSGHTARKKNEELAAAGLHLGVGDPKPAKLHPFTHCPSVFASGGQLGGHMRKHYEGNVAPMPPKKPVIDPMPIASASRSSSAEPNPPNADSVAIGVESSGNHANKVVVRPPCSPRSLQGQQPAAPEVVVAQDQPTVAQGQQLPEEAARQFFVRQAAEPQAVAHHVQRASPPRPERDEYGYWFCREKGCGARFLSYSGLGSHISCHTARKRIELAAASVFASGGQLGGHMKHYEGNVAPRKPVIDHMPIPFASQSSSAEPNPLPNDDSVAIVVESSGNHTNKAVVRPPCSPRFLQGHQPAAPQVVVAQAQPTVAQGHQHAEEAARQFVPHKAAAPQVAAHHAQRTLPPPPPPARDEQGWWLCKEEGCDRRSATPQELGVHMLSHNMSQDSEAAAVALHLGIGPATFHPCKHCPSVFTSGKQLGSHMRKHYEGNVTPKKPGATPNVSARELTSALAPPVPMPPATMEVTPAQPAVAPSSPVLPVPGGPRIFGVNFVVSPRPGAAAEESSSVVTETDQSSGACTDMEQ